MTNKTYEQLMTEYWGRVVPMVDEYNAKHGTDVKPWECIKYLDNSKWLYHAAFTGACANYSFAVAILEGKPVFVGDSVYSKRNGFERIVAYTDQLIASDVWTLTPPKPKSTFRLNGFELPCPVTERLEDDYALKLRDRHVYWFRTREDRDKVQEAFAKILTEARDKS